MFTPEHDTPLSCNFWSEKSIIRYEYSDLTLRKIMLLLEFWVFLNVFFYSTCCVSFFLCLLRLWISPPFQILSIFFFTFVQRWKQSLKFFENSYYVMAETNLLRNSFDFKLASLLFLRQVDYGKLCFLLHIFTFIFPSNLYSPDDN